MRLNKDEHNKRNSCLLKSKLWFGNDNLNLIFKDYDFYLDENTYLIYVYEKVTI
jgi:hypothetical protein